MVRYWFANLDLCSHAGYEAMRSRTTIPFHDAAVDLPQLPINSWVQADIAELPMSTQVRSRLLSAPLVPACVSACYVYK